MRNWVNLTYSLASVSVIAECLEKKTLTKSTNKEINKISFPANKYNILALVIK